MALYAEGTSAAAMEDLEQQIMQEYTKIEQLTPMLEAALAALNHAGQDNSEAKQTYDHCQSQMQLAKYKVFQLENQLGAAVFKQTARLAASLDGGHEAENSLAKVAKSLE